MARTARGRPRGAQPNERGTENEKKRKCVASRGSENKLQAGEAMGDVHPNGARREDAERNLFSPLCYANLSVCVSRSSTSMTCTNPRESSAFITSRRTVVSIFCRGRLYIECASSEHRVWMKRLPLDTSRQLTGRSTENGRPREHGELGGDGSQVC